MENKVYTVGILTLGCKVNQYESEAIAEELEKNGVCVVAHNRICDAYIINTCTVTAESDRKAKQFIRRAISKNPDAYIVVTGCLAQSSPEELTEILGVDAVVGNTEKLIAAHKVLELLKQGKKNLNPAVLVSDIDAACFEQMSITSFGRTRAYVKIEDGCENRCTYCIIPSARGKVRSKAPEDIIKEVTELTKNGCREIVLTGIETASYGKDLGDVRLEDLLEQVDAIEGVGRVRLGSLDPSLIRPEFAEKTSKLSSLAPHFHLSLQSGSSRILALMKRKYNADMAMRAIELLREKIPNVKFTTDVIVGFPDETDEDFEATADFVSRANFLMVHIFPYSKRKGTLAAEMKNQIPTATKKERLHALEAIAAQSRKRILEEKIMSSPECTVLFETFLDGIATGHTDDFIEVAVKSDSPLHAKFKKVRLTHTDGSLCFGELL